MRSVRSQLAILMAVSLASVACPALAHGGNPEAPAPDTLSGVVIPSAWPAQHIDSTVLDAGVRYEIADGVDDQGNPQQTAYAVVNGRRHAIVSNERASIEATADLDQDGVAEVLISNGHSGNCCQPDFAIYTILDGAVVGSALEFGMQHVFEGEPGSRHLRSTTSASGTRLYRFRHGRLIMMLEVLPLKAVVEVEGVAPWPDPPQPPKLLYADLDDDGSKERIVCEINLHFGSIDCALPRADASIQSIGECDRFGMLSMRLHGRHVFVCNNDTLVVFDGYQWRLR